MRLREDLRTYVAQLNNESVHTGVPMMRSMILEFPDAVATAGDLLEMQFAFGTAAFLKRCRPRVMCALQYDFFVLFSSDVGGLL